LRPDGDDVEHHHPPRLAARDSFAALTELLHRAYAPLAAQGLNFTAATQAVGHHAQRAAEGQCFVAESGRELVGTVTVCGPYDVETAPWTAEVPWFRDRDTAHFHQFAVDPAYQRQGLGRRLVQVCEDWARKRGYAPGAGHRRAGHRVARAVPPAGLCRRGPGAVDGQDYRSVIMQRNLDRSPLREHLQTLARYNLWATRRTAGPCRCPARSRLPARPGPVLPSVHGTLNHLLLGEHELWFAALPRAARTSPRWTPKIEPDRRAAGASACAKGAGLAAADRGLARRPPAGHAGLPRIDGQAVTLPFAATLAHVFNHGTHHRGQISAALTALGRPCPELDLVFMLQQESASR
jgi:uncharacterized damage-inducible protein DinB/GNAT superfamily N-acetyltransferase